MTAKQQYG